MNNNNKTKEQLVKELVKIHKSSKKLEAKAEACSKSKKSLKNAVREYQSVFDSEKDLVMVLNTQFKVKKANLATSRFLEKPLNEIVGETCCKLIHGIDNPPRECPLNIINRSKKHEEAECYLSEKDMWLQVSSDPIFNGKGKMTKIVHIVRDITQFRRTEASLRESERRFRTVFDYANHGIHIMDMAEKKTLMVNKKLCQMLDYSKEEFKKLKVDDIYPQKDLPHIIEQLRKLLREEIDITRNISLLRRDGTVIYTDVSAAPFMLGGKTYIMCIFRDITEHKNI
jgi:PAS domain S-box-containing protein